MRSILSINILFLILSFSFAQPGGCEDFDGDLVCDDVDVDENNPYNCSDVDLDTCDDCSQGTFDPANDGADFDGDGMCDAGDMDDDNDGALDPDDSDDNNPFICSDWDDDDCEDCSSGTFNPDNDGCSNGCDEGYVEDCSGDGDCCPESWIGDGWCDDEDQLWNCNLICYDDEYYDCNDPLCDEAGGGITELIGNGYCDEFNFNEFCDFDGGDCECTNPGDANQDSAVNVLDVVAIVTYIIYDGNEIEINIQCSDVNSDDAVNVLDVVEIVSYILDASE